MKDLIANQLVKYLEARGIEHIFGLCGHTNIAVLAALSKSKKIKFVNTRHEQNSQAPERQKSVRQSEFENGPIGTMQEPHNDGFTFLDLARQ